MYEVAASLEVPVAHHTLLLVVVVWELLMVLSPSTWCEVGVAELLRLAVAKALPRDM